MVLSAPLNAVLASNFNVLYSNTLSESQKEELKNILSISYDDLITKSNELSESILRLGYLLLFTQIVFSGGSYVLNADKSSTLVFRSLHAMALDGIKCMFGLNLSV